MNAALSFKTYRGQEIETIFDDLAQLRITVFRDFPYLYEGTVAYEKEYLKTYIQSPQSFLFSVFDKEKMVGATTCIPLADETQEVREPFEKAKMDIERIFYYGESLLLSNYRGLGLGHRYFDEREAHARQFGIYNKTCFCAVVRPENHLLKPLGYRPLDDFWTKRGYQKNLYLQSQFEWLDIGDTNSTYKPMIYWVKDL